MATQAFRIVSQYDPPQDDPNNDILALTDDGWSTGHTFGPSKRILHPPKFVRPSGDYDEYGRPKAASEDDEIQIIEHRPSNLGQWYGGLSRTRTTASTEDPTLPPPRPVSAPAEPSTSSRSKGNGVLGLPSFLQNLSHRLEQDSRPMTAAASTSSIPEMLSRAPPPLPSEKPFVPPTFTVLGPSNKGYTMLEGYGWREGETLGPGDRHHAVGKKAGLGYVRKQEEDEDKSPTAALRDGGHLSANDVVDLTLEDDSDDNDDSPAPVAGSSNEPPRGRALLTPLPTVMRADNAGIGSTRGTKRVITQSAHALDLVKRRKKRRNPDVVVHVGAKALINKAKKDQADKAALLAYLKES